ncbi:hypothetical protein BEWA_025680 [Theileria equi strain WA]|uniref:Uncharacterized protein n=1 Tax=Theileria equi strain WA TaxID=1537102 RepID=L0AXT1_THEEQ|nr:hypothetical protein BEWA_025680 [Theileria equi strain WA]AFZ79719.1 hypothetical protein BEWA_025680 [Theileria equi strain WA]|eukprot:XP_004829385.1 hypothetical protein BEWA_025680 [Theileria equi strain WA]
MNDGVRLDLNPKNGTTEKYGIKRSENEEGLKEYKSYKYSKHDSGSFILSSLSYDRKPLQGILSYALPVTSITTYFNKDRKKLLLIQIALPGGNNWYYTNPDTKENPENLILTKFIPQNNVTLEISDLKNILQTIKTNNGFNILELYRSHSKTAQKLVKKNYIIFDLTQKPNPGGKTTYSSEVTNEQVAVSESKRINGTYPEVKHDPGYSQFRVLGIRLPDKSYMKVDGFPDGLVEKFHVYYGRSDQNYGDPLLVDLKLVASSVYDISYFPSRYYITKNTPEGKWDIRKIFSEIKEKHAFPIILQNIVSYKKLDVDKLENTDGLREKLGDIRGGLTIDLTKTEGAVGIIQYYSSDGVSIPYKKESSTNTYVYHSTRHAYGIPGFTVKNIKTGSGNDITEDKLPPSSTLLGGFYANYSGSGYERLLFLELICFHYPTATEFPVFFYYYSKDENYQWQGYILTTTMNNSTADVESVIEHIKENYGKINLERLGDKLTGKLTKYTPDTLEVEKDESKGKYTGLSTEAIAGISIAGVSGTGIAGITIWKWPSIVSFLITRL